MLNVTDAVVRYGTIEALHGVSFDIEQGEIVTLLGANGAGKSTTLRMISGLHAPVERICRLRRARPHQSEGPRARRPWASATCPRGVTIFPAMTVEENLEMGAFRRKGPLGDDIDEIYETVPDTEGAPQAAGGELLGRRAADARDRACPHVEASTAPPR